MCFRVSKNRDSIIVFPCSREDVLAFMVPPNLFTKPGRLYRIISKAFVDELCSYNNLDINTNYSVPGKYDEKSNVAVFNLIDAHEATLGKGEENA